MTEVTIRKVENGYILEHHPDGPYENEGSEVYVAATDRDMIDHVTEVFFGGVPDIVKVETARERSIADFEDDGGLCSIDEPARPQPNSPQEAETLAAAEALAGETVQGWARHFSEGNQVSNGDAQDG